MNSKPNFFIVGAPKSGTTALWSYLSQHPEVFMCRPKEPQFFSDDTCGEQRNVRTLSEYLACFEEARTPAIGEASTCYLSSPRTPNKIREFCSDARIIVMLRNPIDVMHAEHNERLVGGSEHIEKFDQAVDSTEPRIFRMGRFKGQRVIRPSYRELVRFSEQLERFLEVFGPSRVHVIVYDEFAEDTERIYKDVLTFLGIAANHNCAFDIVNANRRIRSSRVHDLLADPPPILHALARTVLPRRVRQRVATSVIRINEQFASRPIIDVDFRRRLALDCADQVQHLGTLLHRDLSRWVA